MPDEIDDREQIARLIYGAFGYAHAGAMTDIKGQPMGAWRDALKAADAILAYEAAKAGDAGAVAGLKLVPIEPTPEMAQALESNFAECLPPSDVHVANWRSAYQAMLAAAPTPPALAAPAGDLGWHPRGSGQKP